VNRAKKRLGQHFLHDPGTIARIVQAGRSSFHCPRCQR
jgi:formamidopyrimidine-DNA glycosylase